jgi:SAM-dependent methyltransferase
VGWTRQNGRVSLSDAWGDEAASYLAWARTPSHDVGFWEFGCPALLELLPAPRGRTVDVGCGEGRFGRELTNRGHHVVGIELNEVLARAAAMHAQSQATAVGSLEALPLASGVADLVTASMVLMDVDDLERAVVEIARVLVPSGRFCFSILHPFNTAGSFSRRDEVEAPFVVEESYFETRRRSVSFERDGLRMTFTHEHRPLSRYFAALRSAGFLVDHLNEPPVTPEIGSGNPNWQRWSRMPNALHVSAVLA